MVWTHNINPVLLDLGPLEIRYYGLFYIVGIAIGYFLLRHFIRKKQLNLTEDELLDLIIYIAFGLLLGSRIFYFIFYNFSWLLQNPLNLFKLWEGGMSFHGGLIGVIAAGYLFCRQKKKNFLEIADYVVMPIAIGLAIGRLGNFINGELFGRPTTLPWAVNFGDGIARHPSQLYEAAKNIIIFSTLWLIKDKTFPTGFRFWLFVTMYGCLRFTIEFVREPDPQLGFFLQYFTMGQLLSGAMIIMGSYSLWCISKQNTRKNSTH